MEYVGKANLESKLVTVTPEYPSVASFRNLRSLVLVAVSLIPA